MDTLLASISMLSGNDADLKQLNSTLVKQESLLLRAAAAVRRSVSLEIGYPPASSSFETAFTEEKENTPAGEEVPGEESEPQATTGDDGVLAALMMEALTSLDRLQHTLGLIHLLNALGTNISENNETGMELFLAHAAPFFFGADKYQVGFAPRTFSSLCHKFAVVCCNAGCPKRGIRALRSACHILAPTDNTLTPVHADFLKVCLLAKCYSVAARWLDEKPVLEICHKEFGLTPVDYLTFFHRAGLVYTGLKRYPEAIENFQLAITAPATSASAIAVECFKKLVLISLIHSGKAYELPGHTSSVLTRPNRTLLPSCYSRIEALFAEEGLQAMTKLSRELETSAQVLCQDRNMGLAKQVRKALERQKIRQLTHTYITLSLGEITASSGLLSSLDGEKIILEMVNKAEIYAKIDQSTGMVRFDEDVEELESEAVMAKLENEIQRTIEMAQRIRELDVAISTSPQYIQKHPSSKRSGPHASSSAWADNDIMANEYASMI